MLAARVGGCLQRLEDVLPSTNLKFYIVRLHISTYNHLTGNITRVGVANDLYKIHMIGGSNLWLSTVPEGPLLPSPSQLHGLCFSATNHYSKSFSPICMEEVVRVYRQKNNIYKCFKQKIYTHIILQYIFWRVGNQSSRFVYMARLQHYALMHAVRVRLG